MKIRLDANDIDFNLEFLETGGFGSNDKWYFFNICIDIDDSFNMHKYFDLEDFELVNVVNELQNLVDGKIDKAKQIEFQDDQLNIILYPKDTFNKSEMTSIYLEEDNNMVINLFYITKECFAGNYIPLFFENKEVLKLIEFFKKILRKF